MNKIYDKLLLALAVLALLAGVGFYFVKSGAVPSGRPQVSTQTANNPYQAVPVPDSEDVSVNWPEPVEQSTGWVYDVFTPPKIFIDEKGHFSAKGWTPPPPPVPFGVYLAEIKRNPYRIQIEGYIEEDLSDASKSLILLYDEEHQKSIRARIGQEDSAADFKVTGFEVERIRDADGSIEKVATATILDLRTNKEVVLKHGERLYEKGVTVILRSKEDPSVEIELTQEGASFDTPAGHYTLEEINLEESAVTVKKMGDDEHEAETKRLSVSTPAPIKAPESETTESQTEPFESGDTFDFM